MSGGTAFNARGRAGFVLANGAMRGHPCSVKIIEDLRQRAAEQGRTEDEALEKGMEANTKAYRPFQEYGRRV